MKDRLLKIINSASFGLILLYSFLSPLLFITGFTDVTETPKNIFLFVVVALLIALLAIRLVLTGFKIKTNPFTNVILALGTVGLLSSYFVPNRYTSLVTGLPSFIATLIFFLLISQLFQKSETTAETSTEEGKVKNAFEQYHLIVITLLVVGILLSIQRLLSFFGLYLPFGGELGNVLKLKEFTPVGNGFSLTVLLGMISPLAVAMLLSNSAQQPLLSVKPDWKSVIKFPVSIVFLITAGVALILTAPQWSIFVALVPSGLVLFLRKHLIGKNTRLVISSIFATFLVVIILFFLPLNTNSSIIKMVSDFPRGVQLDLKTGWIIAVSAIRDLPFFGSGLGTYLNDFLIYRPISFNATPLWDARFNFSTNLLLQVIPTMGIAGIAAFIAMFYVVIREVVKSFRKSAEKSNLEIALGASLIAFTIGSLLSVPSTVVVSLFLLLLALFAVETGLTRNIEARLKFEGGHDVVGPVLLLPLLTASVAIVYLTARFALGDIYFVKSINAYNSQKDFNTIFTALQNAIRNNPYIDKYHTFDSVISFRFADVTAGDIKQKGYSLTADPKEAAPSADISNSRALLVQLVDIAVKEARSAVFLNPTNSDNVANLGDIYKNIAGAVPGSADLAVEAYQQAALLNPANPLVRVSLGGIYMLAGDPETASNYFRDAVLLKEDLAVSHFNLALAYSERKSYPQAVFEMEKVTRIVPMDSDDYKYAKGLLEQLQKLLPKSAAEEIVNPKELVPAASDAELAQPSEEKIKLPEETISEKKTPEETPSPTVTPTE